MALSLHMTLVLGATLMAPAQGECISGKWKECRAALIQKVSSAVCTKLCHCAVCCVLCVLLLLLLLYVRGSYYS